MATTFSSGKWDLMRFGSQDGCLAHRFEFFTGFLTNSGLGSFPDPGDYVCAPVWSFSKDRV